MIRNEKKKKPKKAILRIVLIVIAACVIGVNVYGINSARLAGDDLPMPFGFGAAVVLSGSMEPALSVGDLIFVVAQDNYAVGDIVVYRDGSSSVTHRIVAMDGDSVTTQGDANNIQDDAIALTQIKGKVAFSLPLVGYLVNIIKTPLGTLVILALAVFLLERSFRADRERDRRQLDSVRAEIEKLKKEQQDKEP